jgi:hypothetical protein
MIRTAAPVVGVYLIASACFELLAAHVDSMRVLSTVRYVAEKDAYGLFYLLNGLCIVAGVGLLRPTTWAPLLTYLLLLASANFSARASAWSVEGFDEDPFFPLFLVLFGLWNGIWAAVLLRSQLRSRSRARQGLR